MKRPLFRRSQERVVRVQVRFRGKLLARVSEAAAVLNVSRSQAYKMIARGQLRAIRVGGTLQVPIDEIARIAGVPPKRIWELLESVPGRPGGGREKP